MARFVTGVLIASALLAGACTAGEIPGTQRAVVQEGNGGPEVLSLQTIPVLEPGPGQVLIEVHAAAVNPIDWKLREGYSPGGGPVGTPPPDEPPARVPGYDVAGVVVRAGSGVTETKVGDAVFAMIGRPETDGLNGAYSEYVIAPAGRVVPKPDSLSFAAAAGLGTVGLTAARIFSLVNADPGQRVFINGIAGGVGSSSAQIAKARGNIVIGTASARHHDYLGSLGVDEVVDYTKVDFTQVVEPVDVYVETVNRDLAVRGLGIIKPGGKLISVVGTPAGEDCAAAGVSCAMAPMVEPQEERRLLEELAGLAASGAFAINIDRTFPLEQAADAQELNREGHTQGKIILIVRPDN